MKPLLSNLRAILRPLGSPRLGIALISLFALYAALASLPIIQHTSPTGELSRVPLRTLAAIDLTEGQWFAWWPSLATLTAIVINMTISMLTRVEWSRRKFPVFLTHTGVALLALGSAIYAAQKQEGQIVLFAPEDPASESGPVVTEMTDASAHDPAPIPGISLALKDLTIETVPATDLARNVTATIRATSSAQTATHTITLNNPLILEGLEPPTCDCLIRSALERLWHNHINPTRWKFSIAGWDHEGWLMSREATIAGIAARPHASFVVLGVGNTPGVRIIATGSITLIIGAAWALLAATFRTPPTPTRVNESPSKRANDGCHTRQRLDNPTTESPTPMKWASEPNTNAPTPQLTKPITGTLLPLLLLLSLTPNLPAQTTLDPTSPLRTIPVQWNGRIAPLDTVARDLIRAVSSRDAIPSPTNPAKTEDPLTTLLNLILDPDNAADIPLISTSAVRLPPPGGGGGTNMPLPKLISIKEAQRILDASSAQASKDPDSLRHLLPLAERLSLAKISARSLPLIAPSNAGELPTFAREDWIDAESPSAPPVITAAFNSLRTAWPDPDPRTTYIAASQLSESLRQHNANHYNPRALWFEAFINAINPMRWAAWLFTLAAIAGLWSFITRIKHTPHHDDPPEEPQQPTLASTLSTWLFNLAWLLHAASFAARWFIANRLPIQNQYESMLGLCLAATTAAAAFALLAPRRLKQQAQDTRLAASIVALIVLWASNTLPIPGISVEPEAAILSTATLLKYHVSTVLVAYAFIAIGGVLSLLWLLTPSRYSTAHLAAAIPTFIKLAFWTLAAGILLGALWADRSWGRWWAFDPKETWALITWCVYLIALHWHAATNAPTAVPLKADSPQSDFSADPQPSSITTRPVPNHTRPLAWLSILGTLVMLWSWFGVNLLLPGLHAYA